MTLNYNTARTVITIVDSLLNSFIATPASYTDVFLCQRN